ELERDETRFLLKRLATDQELPLRWGRYHLVRQSMRRQEMSALAPGFADAVMARLDLEPGVQTHAVTSWLRWGAGGAIAASVAVAALVLTRPAVESTTGAGPLVARNASQSGAPIAVAPVAAAAVSTSEFRPPLLAPNMIEAAPVNFGSDLSQPMAVDPRMQSYLIRHYQAAGAGGQSDFVPYVLLATPQRESAKPQAEPAHQNH
ncbi:MAG: sigma-E factor negative regulatory protein, partial [Dokdonella sp.]